MESNVIATLQETINKRAAARLDADLMEVCKFMRGNRLMAATDSGYPALTYDLLKEEGKEKPNQKTQPPYWVFQFEKGQYGGSINSSVFMDKVREFWLPVYIQEETKAFIEKVDQVRKDTDYLLDRDHLHEIED